MTPAEVGAFLAGHRSMALATLGPGGFPHVVAMAYTMLDGAITFWGESKSQKIVNLGRDPRVGCLVADGTEPAELRGVSVAGEAELITGPDGIRRIATALLVAHYGSADDSRLHAPLDVLVPRRLGVRVHPVHIASWDHTKVT